MQVPTGEEPIPPRRGSPLKRFAWRWAEGLLGALVLLTTGAVLTAIQAVYTMPSRLAATEARAIMTASIVDSMRMELTDVGVATWTFVGLTCLQMNDSALVNSKLPCGKAFRISGITRSLTR